MNICCDCIHHRPRFVSIGFGAVRDPWGDKCARVIDPVTGGAGSYCRIQRDPRFDCMPQNKRCGSEGGWFEQAPPPPPRRRWWRFWA